MNRLESYHVAKSFIEANREKISHIYQQKGGWEGWLQCELAYHFVVDHGVPVIREVWYNANDRADLYLDQQDPLIIELKCSSMANMNISAGHAIVPTAGGLNEFVGDILLDKAKIEGWQAQGHEGLSLAFITAFNLTRAAYQTAGTRLVGNGYGAEEVHDLGVLFHFPHMFGVGAV